MEELTQVWRKMHNEDLQIVGPALHQILLEL